MDVLAKRGSFGDHGHVRKGNVLKGLTKGAAEKLIQSGCYVEATPEAIKEFETAKRAAKKRGSAEQSSLNIGLDAAAMEKLFGEIRKALDEFKEGVTADLNQMKERLAAGDILVSGDLTADLAALKEAVSEISGKIAALPKGGEKAGEGKAS